MALAAYRFAAGVLANFAARLPSLSALLLAALALLACQPATGRAEPRLPEYFAKFQIADVFPGADHLGPVTGTPPAAAAYAGSHLLGYVFLNSDVVNSAGYSGKPISIVIGISSEGKIVGAKLVDHHEPIVLVGIPQAKIEQFIHGYVGLTYDQIPAAARKPPVDIVSGATVTTMVIGDTITRSAIQIARSRGLAGAAAEPVTAAAETKVIDATKSAKESWQALLGDGSVRRLDISVGDVNKAFEHSGNQEAISHPEAGDPDDTFIDLYVGLASAPAIGRSLLGDAAFEQLQQSLKPGQQAIVVAGHGRYSFKGSGYVRGGIFDRIELIQGENTIRFHDRNQTRLVDLAAEGAPNFREISLFTLPQGSAFDPAAPWRLQLLVQRAIGARDKAFLTFGVDYTLPDKYLKIERRPPPQAAPATPASTKSADATAQAADLAAMSEPLWQRIWRSKIAEIVVLCVALLFLTAIFFFQDVLVKRPVLYDRIRLGYLAFTVLFIGWYTGAQLSIVNVLTFATALRGDFKWDYFLMDPLIFILWFAVAASLLFWNRGAFCGWLCPFGALQELTNRAARLLKIPQINVPFAVHQRLWVIKYVIFLVLFGLSLYSLSFAEKASEVEPFKTAIVLHFLRAWPFVAFALVLLGASLFIERFYCRYMCPLGAALAISARLRIFDWLRRYRECGNPCQRCAVECPVQAIHPEGHINPNECIQCLHCQMLYHHDQKCPVMIQKRLKREKREAMTSPSMKSEPARSRRTNPVAGE